MARIRGRLQICATWLLGSLALLKLIVLTFPEVEGEIAAAANSNRPAIVLSVRSHAPEQWSCRRMLPFEDCSGKRIDRRRSKEFGNQRLEALRISSIFPEVALDSDGCFEEQNLGHESQIGENDFSNLRFVK